MLRRFLSRWREFDREVAASDLVPARAQTALLAGLVLLILAVRLAGIGTPAIDRTAWKEIDYIQISTGYWQGGHRFLEPAVAWPAEPPRVTAMEFPLVPFAAGLLYPLSGVSAVSVRWVTLVAFCLLPLAVFRLTRRELGPAHALLAALAAAGMPLLHYFGNLLFSEPAMLLCSVVGLERFAAWVERRGRREWWCAAAGLSGAVLLKLEPLYLLLPVAWLARRGLRRDPRTLASATGLVLVALVPPALWYGYAARLASTSIDLFGLFGGHDKFQTLTMLARPEWYVAMGWRLVWLVGGKAGVLLCVAGALAALRSTRARFFVAYGAAIAAYFALVAEGNLDAPYRQLHAVPVLAALMAMGAMGIAGGGAAALVAIDPRRFGTRRAGRAAFVGAAAVVFLVFARGYGEVARRDPLAPADQDGWRLASEIRRHARTGDRLVALGEYTVHVGGNDLSPVLYYYAGLQGWTLQRPDWRPERVEELRARGAGLLAARHIDREAGMSAFLAGLRGCYPVLYEDSEAGHLLLDLRRPFCRAP